MALRSRLIATLAKAGVRRAHSVTVTLHDPSEFIEMPWANGKGVTTQLAKCADRSWRLSRAKVDSDGEFSQFPGLERVLTVLPCDTAAAIE